MRNDFDAGRLGRAVLRETLSTLAHGALFPFGYLGSRYRSPPRVDVDTFVFLHGYGANRACFFPLQGLLSLRGCEHQLSLNTPARGSPEEMAARLAEALDEHVHGGRVHIVGHSLGGLIARYYVQALGGHEKVSTLVTLATPHRGTLAFTYMRAGLLKHLRPDSAFIRALNDLPPPPSTRFHSFGAKQDHLVIPAESALCPIGDGRIFDEATHNAMLLSPTVLRAVQRVLIPEGSRSSS